MAALGTAFASGMAEVNGTALHYVYVGNGPGVILLHGFPQDWYAYHKVMPRLAKSFTVVAAIELIDGDSAAAIIAATMKPAAP